MKHWQLDKCDTKMEVDKSTQSRVHIRVHISERDSWLHLTVTIEIATYPFLPQSVSVSNL